MPRRRGFTITHPDTRMHPPPENDDRRLSELLEVWKVDPPEDPGFARAVRARLERETPATHGFWREVVTGWMLTRSALGYTVLAFALVGSLAAVRQTRASDAGRIERLAAEYVRSIDPVAMTADHHHPR